MYKMWLLDYVTRNSFSKTDPALGGVTSSDMGTVAVDAELEHRNMPIVAPFGIAYNPPVNEKSVVLPLNSKGVCIGVVSPYKNLQPGELMLFSKGGASILLKNNGDVVINGKVFGE